MSDSEDWRGNAAALTSTGLLVRYGDDFFKRDKRSCHRASARRTDAVYAVIFEECCTFWKPLEDADILLAPVLLQPCHVGVIRFVLGPLRPPFLCFEITYDLQRFGAVCPTSPK